MGVGSPYENGIIATVLRSLGRFKGKTFSNAREADSLGKSDDFPR